MAINVLNSWSRLQKIAAALFLFLIAAALFSTNITLTGLVTYKNNTQLELNTIYTSNTSQTLDIPDNLTSMQISGSISGSGSAKVYLKTRDSRILLIETAGLEVNDKSSNNLITGNVVSDTINLSVPNQPIDNTSRDNTSAKNISTENVSVNNVSVNSISVENLSVENISVENVSVTNVSTDNVFVDNLSVNTAFIDNISLINMPIENISAIENISVNTNPVENISVINISDENISMENKTANASENAANKSTSSISFVSYCKDSCLMSNTHGPYTLVVDIDGNAALNLSYIQYTYILPVETNITENLTNETSLNVSLNVSIGNYTENLSKISADVLQKISIDGNARVIIKSRKPLATIAVSDDKNPKVNLNIASAEHKIVSRHDVANAFSKVHRLDIPSMVNKTFIANMSNLVEVKAEGKDYQSVVVNSTSIAELSTMPDINSIVIDKPMALLTNESMNITNIIDVHTYGYYGSGKKICIIDTGVNYTALGLVMNSTIFGTDIVNKDDNPMDDNGHGTQVAYIINSVAPASAIYDAKVMDANGVGYESDVLAGLQYCMDNKVDVISFSIGAGLSSGYCDDDLVANLSDVAVDNGIFVVAATGNDASLTQIRAPACAINVVRVAASTKSDGIASFSNINNMIDLLAPGQNIIVKGLDGSSTTVSGTSFAAPFVAGTAALMLENRSMTPAELRYLLRSTSKVIDFNGIPRDRMDAYNALIGNKTNEPYVYNAQETNVSPQNYQLLSNTGFHTPGTAVNTASNGTTAWVSPMNATTMDSKYAMSAMAITGNSTLLNLTNYTINMPRFAQVTGIQVLMQRLASGANVRDDWIYLEKNSKIIGTNHSAVATWGTGTNSNASYGNDTDLWGTTWTGDDINSMGFGVIVKTRSTAVAARTAEVDVVWVNVTYTFNDDTINVSSNQSAYNVSGNVNVSGYYMFTNGSTFGAKNITVKFINTTNIKVYEINTTSNASGYYTANYTLPATADLGVWDINVTGIYDNVSNATNTTTFTVTGNAAPVMKTSRISPISPYTNDTLIGYCNATDTNGTYLNYSYNWYQNGTLNRSGTYNNSLEGLETNVGNISSSSLVVGQNWTLSCMATDGSLNSSWMNSSNVTILALPYVNITFISPTPANGTVTTNTSVMINISVNTTSLNNFTFDWNGTNYSIYDPSLLLMYNFDNVSALGESGTKWVDVSKYGKNASCFSTCPLVNITNSKFGNSVTYYKATSKGINSTLNFNFTTITLEAWIRPVSNATGTFSVDDDIISNGAWGNFDGVEFIGVHSNSDTPAIRFSLIVGGGSTGIVDIFYYYNATTHINNWHHVAATYNGTVGTIYYDGVPVASGTGTAYMINSTHQFMIGARSDDAENFNGSIDEVRVYNRSLSAAEIQQQYYSNLNKYASDGWQFIVNESNLTAGVYTYYGYVNDTNGLSNQTEIRYLTIGSQSNNLPTIASVQAISGVNPVESSYSNISLNFTVNDMNGNATINISSAKIFVNYSGIYRNTSSCSGLAINNTAVNVSCNLSMQYYDPAGIWSINVSISDNSNAYIENITTTFTYNELQAITISTISASFGPASTALENVSTTPFTINNTGNVNFSIISMTGYDLVNGTFFIGSGNFSVNITNNSVGNVMRNNTVVNITGAYLQTNNDTFNSNETIYMFVDVPSAMPALKYKSISSWIVSLIK